jgi:iron complex outermembrane recepter protein
VKFIVPVSCASVLALTSFNAIAQDTSQPEVSLPSVTVVVKEKPPQKQVKVRKTEKATKKSTVAKAAPAPSFEPQTAESTGDSQQPETALGPVQGLVATRTGTGSKTDTPIVEVPRTVNVVTEDQITEQQPPVRQRGAWLYARRSESDRCGFDPRYHLGARFSCAHFSRWLAVAD